jgi:hypothetical protein
VGATGRESGARTPSKRSPRTAHVRFGSPQTPSASAPGADEGRRGILVIFAVPRAAELDHQTGRPSPVPTIVMLTTPSTWASASEVEDGLQFVGKDVH